MSREELLGLATDMDRYLAAGAVTATASDKLRQRGKIVKDLSQKVPGLVPLSQGIEKVLKSEGKASAPAILDLLVMTQQLRRSLAAPGVSGDLTAEHPPSQWQSSLPNREFRLLLEAIQGETSGREDTLKKAVEAKRIADLRLLSPTFEVLGSGNHYLADIVSETILPAFGPSLLHELEANLDLAGKSINARRLKVICKIDPVKGRDWCLKALEQGSPSLKVQALDSLAELGKADELEAATLELVKDKNKEVRIASVRWMKKSKGEEAIPHLIEAARSESWEFYPSAEKSLKEIAFADTSLRLIDAIKSITQDYELASQAIDTAKKEKKQGVPAKVTKGKKSTAKQVIDPVVIATAKRDLIALHLNRLIDVVCTRKDKHRKAVGKVIMEYVDSPAEEVFAAAINGLGKIGPVIPEIRPFLEKTLEDKKPRRVELAINSFSNMTPKDREPSIPAILKAFEKGKLPNDIRGDIFGLLPPHFAKHKAIVVKMVRETLKDNKLNHLHVSATVCVKEIGEPAKELLPDVLEFVKNGYSFVYEIGPALLVLESDGKTSIPKLISFLTSKTKTVLTMAAEALGSFGPKAAEAIPHLEKHRTDKDSSVRYHMENAIRSIQK